MCFLFGVFRLLWYHYGMKHWYRVIFQIAEAEVLLVIQFFYFVFEKILQTCTFPIFLFILLLFQLKSYNAIIVASYGCFDDFCTMLLVAFLLHFVSFRLIHQ